MNNNLPPNWSWVKLGDVAKSFKGKKPISQSREQDEIFSIPYVDIKAFEQRGIDNYTDGVKCTLCEPEDVLIVWDGARCGLVGRGIKGAIGSTLAKIKSETHLNSFLFYFLKNKYRIINTKPKGVGIPHIEPNLFWNFEIPLPPLPEQKKIVEKIEELFSGLDSGVASLKKAKAQIRLYRQSVLASAFSGKLTQRAKRQAHSEMLKAARQSRGLAKRRAEPNVEYSTQLPGGWKWVKVSDVGEIVTGTTPSKKVVEYYGNDFPLYKPTDLNAGINTREASDNISKLGATKARLLPEKSTMVTCIGATIGKTGMNKIPGTTNQQINSIIPNKNYIPEFVYYFCISEFFQDQIKTNASSTTLPILNKSKFEILPFIQIPLNQQTQIVEEIESRFAGSEALEKAIDDSLAKSEILRQSILSQAFSGKLV